MTSPALLLNRFSSAKYAHERKLLLRLSINDINLAEGGRDANPVQPYSRGSVLFRNYLLIYMQLVLASNC